MTTHDKDKIIAAAKEAGIRKAFVCAIPDTCPDDDNCCHNRKPDGYWVKDEQLERFYDIAFEAGRQDEREECAKVCESGSILDYDSVATAENCAEAIRARGDTK